ncbi:MAG: TSUP family transporter [Gammaproteobacteria bacterium]|nr:TSUP family transporter [Gammaproteobacteria bacterium]
MTFALIVIGSVLATSILSGVIGMAGGMILMAILVAISPVATAMIVHGAVQAMSNGSRSWFLRRHIVWSVLPAYLVGSAIAMVGFVALTVIPNASIVLILVGIFPWLGRLTSHLSGLDVTRPLTGACCGALVTAAQLLAGASGPLLDVFYLNTPLNRHQIIASKALTQTLGHILKIIYYGGIVGFANDAPLWLIGIAMLTAVAGARIGTRLLDHLDEANFRRYSSWVILGIGAACVLSGVYELAAA